MPKKGSASPSSSKYTMMSGKKVAAPMGYTSSPTASKKSSSRVGEDMAASSNSVDAENPANIGCHAGNVYEGSYLVSRCYPLCIVGSMNSCAQLEARGMSPQALINNPYTVQYRCEKSDRGSERHGNVKKALVKEARIRYVKSTFPVQLLLTSSELQGRTYTQDGKRGLLSVPSDDKLEFPEGYPIYLTPQIDNTFLRYANVDAKQLLSEKFVENRLGEDGKMGERYAVPIESKVGRVIKSNTTLNEEAVKMGRKDLHSVGIGPKFTVQLHSVAKDHFDLSPAQFSKAVALLVSASNRGRPINMGCLDIGIAPVTGGWKDSCGLEEWAGNDRSLSTVRDVPFKVELELEIIYRLMGHRDMYEQSQ